MSAQKKKPKSLEKQEQEVLDSYDSWLKRQRVKDVRAKPGNMAGKTTEDR